MFEIAGGIILAVLFFFFLPLIIVLSLWLVGIALVIALYMLVYFGLLNYVSSDNAVLILMFISVISYIFYSLYKNRRDSKNLIDSIERATIEIDSHISEWEKRVYIRGSLQHSYGVIFVVIFKDSTKFIITFNPSKTNIKDIEKKIL